MTDLLSDDTDFEISKYYEASDMIDAGINPAIEKNKKSVFNPETSMNDVLLPMSSGGYVKISEEAPEVMAEAPMQPAMPSVADLGPTQGAADVTRSPMRLAGVVPSKTSSSGNVISETVKGLARGGIVRPAQFLKENFDIYDPLVIQIVNPVTGEFDPDLKILSREEKEQLDADMAAGNLPYAFDFEKIVETSENAGIAAQLAGGISQFVGAFAGLGKLFRIGKGITGGITQGAAADFLAFRGDEGRITDLLLEMGVDESLVPSFLVTDPNDPDYVGRFKTAFEGGVFGGLAEPAIRAIGKTYRGIKDGDMPAEEIDQAVEAGKQGLLQTVIQRLNQPGPMPTTSMFGAGEIDRGLAAAGRLADGKKPSADELRRQANIQRFGYDPNEAPDTSYRMEHQPRGPEDGEGIRLDDLTKNISGEQAGYPDDFYTGQGMEIYARGPSFEGDEYGLANQESYEIIASVKGNPDAEVTIYRAVPDEDAITTINPGDFVTLSPTYAKLHGASGYGRSSDEAGKVLEQKVKVRDIYWDGNDVNEFGYFPEEK